MCTTPWSAGELDRPASNLTKPSLATWLFILWPCDTFAWPGPSESVQRARHKNSAGTLVSRSTHCQGIHTLVAAGLVVKQACAGDVICRRAQQRAELCVSGHSSPPAVLQPARARSQSRVCSDMMSRVARRAAAYNNAAGVADSWPRTAAKLGYYQALKLAYGFAGRCTQARPASFLRGVLHVWGMA